MKKLINDYKLTEYGTSAYLAVMFLAFPLCFHNSYIDIMETKTFFFVAATCLYLIAFVVLLWLESVFQAEKKRKLHVKSEKKAKPSTTAKKKGILYQDIFFIIFLAAVVISTLCSGDIIKAWYSTECKMFGTMILLLCCGVYFYVSAGYVINRAVKICLSAGIGIVFILAILNRYGIDPLNMQSILYEHQRPIYISTIGNVNILANFICIFLPLFMGAFLYAEKIPDKVISGLLVYTGVMAGIAANSDSFFLGFGAGLIFLLWFSMTSTEKMANYFMMCAVCAAAMLSLKLFNSISAYSYVWYSVQSALIGRFPWLIITAGFAVIALIAAKRNFALGWRKIRRAVFIVLGTGLVVFIGYVIKVNLFGGVNVNEILIFNESWGTNRGFVWIHTCELFRELPFYHQVVGIGPGGFRDFFEIYNMQRAAQSLADFADPHSEFLYYLVSTGIIGFIGYFGMIISAIIACVKMKTKNTIILAAAFVSWIAQGAVNNPLVFTTPYLFIFLAMARHEAKNSVIEGLYMKHGGKK